MKLPIYKLYIDDLTGVKKMSLVDTPAVDVDFQKFSKVENLNFKADEDKHIVFGVAMRADYPIYRSDSRGEYFIQFDKETVKQCAQKFLKDGHVDDVNLNHAKDTNGVYIIESFIKDISKGINPTGFEEVEDGSWFCSYKVDNDEVWRDVKLGKFNGFSVEVSGHIVEIDELDEYIKDLIN